ncbi:hypothetical protein CPB86DRAFT_723784 [Serendipita vermifera]|nr:hypothetical protein CPB86DRAFT_723784 [Serendipita vermifera]
MDPRLTTSPKRQKDVVSPVTAFQQLPSSIMSPKTSSVPVRPSQRSSIGIPRNETLAGTENNGDYSYIDPDDLFARYTVAEVKSIAAKLNGEAEAKQEELRLMVGERYRDLLQASKSIIDMASQSQNVLDSLKTMREICSEKNTTRTLTVAKSGSETDTQLRALQSLAAHLKLLLDCPEQFWRLLERKQYLDAVWLFLVTRFVHQSLVDDGEEDGWAQQGIDVLEQFPLIQRQWDAIAGFRTQISYRITQSLREELPTQEIIRSMISFFLLESMPLRETLNTLLSQRMKSFQAYLSDSEATLAAGEDEMATVPGQSRQRRNTRKVEQTICHAIGLLVNTVHSARVIFIGNGPQSSLIEQTLIDIQADAKDAIISTKKVLAALPSASLLDLYLPASIKSYTHFIDTSSASFQLTPSSTSSKLSQWFEDGVDSLEFKLQGWIDALYTVSDVHRVKRAALASFSKGSLPKEETEKITSCLEKCCSDRIGAIWRDTFRSVREEFSQSLTHAIKKIEGKDSVAQKDSDPFLAMFSTDLPYPVSAAANLSRDKINSSFTQFNDIVAKRRRNLTPLLTAVISDIEKRCQGVFGEVATISENNSSRKADLLAHIMPLTGQLHDDIVASLEHELKHAKDAKGEHNLPVIVFVGRVANALSGSSLLGNFTPEWRSSISRFNTHLTRIHDNTLSIWRTSTVDQIIENMGSALKNLAHSKASINDSILASSSPSPFLVDSLLSLISASRMLGLSRSQVIEKEIFSKCFLHIANAFVATLGPDTISYGDSLSQLIFDLFFLQAISKEMGADFSAASKIQSYSNKMKSNMADETVQTFIKDSSSSALQSLLRLQLLLSPLFYNPDHSSTSDSTPLLSLGNPPTESRSTLPIALAQPSARFGLVLVAGSMGSNLR